MTPKSLIEVILAKELWAKENYGSVDKYVKRQFRHDEPEVLKSLDTAAYFVRDIIEGILGLSDDLLELKIRLTLSNRETRIKIRSDEKELCKKKFRFNDGYYYEDFILEEVKAKGFNRDQWLKYFSLSENILKETKLKETRKEKCRSDDNWIPMTDEREREIKEMHKRNVEEYGGEAEW